MSEAEIKRKGGRLRIAGEMTIYQAAALKDELVNAVRECANVELDLADVSEFDSAGFQLIAMARREAQAHGKTVTVCAASDAVKKVLTGYRTESWLKVKAAKKGARRVNANEV